MTYFIAYYVLFLLINGKVLYDSQGEMMVDYEEQGVIYIFKIIIWVIVSPLIFLPILIWDFITYYKK